MGLSQDSIERCLNPLNQVKAFGLDKSAGPQPGTTYCLNPLNQVKAFGLLIKEYWTFHNSGES